MSIFRSKKKFTITQEDPTYKVRYLGNVQTALMKGDGCVDKPTGVLWNNFLKNSNAGLDMSLSVCASGLKAHTKEQGLTEYRAHRISYCIAHPNYPKLFVWVYRHEGKKMKVELRCHAVLCKNADKAKALAVHLHEKLAMALSEFMREKQRRQTSRLALQKAASLQLPQGENIVPGASSITTSSGGVSGVLTRKKFLNTSQNFKPPVEKSSGAPKLGAITEDHEEAEEEEEEEEEEEDMLNNGRDSPVSETSASSTPSRYQPPTEGRIHIEPSGSDPELQLTSRSYNESNEINELANSVFDIEIGNDIEELKGDEAVQFQLQHAYEDSDESSESGFAEQDNKEALSASVGSASSTLTSGSCNSPSSPHQSSHKTPPVTEHVSEGDSVIQSPTAEQAFVIANGDAGL